MAKINKYQQYNPWPTAKESMYTIFENAANIDFFVGGNRLF